jgi:hypothetical protein
MLDIRPLNEELQRVAREQLNEDPEEIEECMRKFKDWISKSPHLRARNDDQFLIAFLRASKHDLEKAKKHLDIFYTLRTKIPDLMRGKFDILKPEFRSLIIYTHSRQTERRQIPHSEQ